MPHVNQTGVSFQAQAHLDVPRGAMVEDILSSRSLTVLNLFYREHYKPRIV